MAIPACSNMPKLKPESNEQKSSLMDAVQRFLHVSDNPRYNTAYHWMLLSLVINVSLFIIFCFWSISSVSSTFQHGPGPIEKMFEFENPLTLPIMPLLTDEGALKLFPSQKVQTLSQDLPPQVLQRSRFLLEAKKNSREVQTLRRATSKRLNVWYGGLAPTTFSPYDANYWAGIGKCGGRNSKLFEMTSDGQELDTLRRNRKIIFGFSLFFLICAIVALVGNGKFREGITSFFDGIAGVIKGIAQSLSKVAKAFDFSSIDLNAWSNNTIYLPSESLVIEHFADSVNAQFARANEETLQIDKYRSIGVGLACAAAFFIVVVSAFASYKTHSRALVFIAIFGWMASFFFWIGYGTQYPFSILAADVCVEFAKKDSNAATSYFLPCSPSFQETVAIQLQSLDTFKQDLYDLKTNLIGRGMNSEADQVQIYINNVDIGIEGLNELLTCSFIPQMVDAVYDSLCVTLLAGFIDITYAFILMAFGVLFFIPVGIRVGAQFKTFKDHQYDIPLLAGTDANSADSGYIPPSIYTNDEDQDDEEQLKLPY